MTAAAGTSRRTRITSDVICCSDADLVLSLPTKVLGVGDFFEPGRGGVDIDSKVCHWGIGSSSMPMTLPRRNTGDVAVGDLGNGLAIGVVNDNAH